MNTEEHVELPPTEGVVTFGILGPFEIRNGEHAVLLKGRKQRALLALLALRAGELVPKDVLVEEIWGEKAPRTARDSLHNCIFQARRAVGRDLVQTRGQSYRLVVDAEHVDLLRFERLVAAAGRARTAAVRTEQLRDALALWRGAVLSDLSYESFVLREAPRLEELRLAARRALIDAELELGRSAELVPELEALVHEHPFHERFYAQLMLALYRSGRQAEALDVYRRARAALLGHLGIDPGPDLRRLEQAILQQSRELDAPIRSDDTTASAHPSRRGRQQRLTVLVRESARTVRALDRAELTKVVSRQLTTFRDKGWRQTSPGVLRTDSQGEP